VYRRVPSCRKCFNVTDIRSVLVLSSSVSVVDSVCVWQDMNAWTRFLAAGSGSALDIDRT